jgi:Zn-dependent peptidase ImmA (M78 family)
MGHKYFVIAHELGHFFLHSDEIIQICDNISDVFNKYDIIKNTESEANIFASELLAPSRMIMKELTDDPIDFRTIGVIGK